MIKGFRLHAKKGKLWLVLLEYGEQPVDCDDIVAAIDATKIGYFNEDAVRDAHKEGMDATLEIASPPPLDLEGSIWVDLKSEENAAKVNVYPPIGTGKTFSEADVRRELDAAGCKDWFYYDDIIRRNLESHRKAKVPAIFKAAEIRDAEITTEIASDRRTAFIKFHKAWGGENLTLEKALEIIEKQGVKFGVQPERVQEILDADKDCEKQRIAGAREPVKGDDASIEYLFDAFQTEAGPVISDETDCADFRDLNLFENVDPEAPLACKIPLTLGENGMDVTGAEIVAEAGKDMQLPKGKNTMVSSDDDNLLVAQCAGTPKLVGTKVNVDEVLYVKEVDFSTGNINFNGDVVVSGPVNAGFSITADGDITCKDTVEAADLTAKGNIYIKRGLKGMNKCQVTAGQNVYARFVENCKIQANESVIVDEAIIHSTVYANEEVEVTNSKGSIFGGSIKGRKLIRAAYIGSEMAVKTELEVGAAPHMKDELTKLSSMVPVKKKELNQASKNFVALNAMRSKAPLSPVKEELFNKLGTATAQLKSELEEIAETIAHLEENLQACDDGRVEATKTIFPGVVITIKVAKKRITEPVNKAIYLKEGPDVVLAVEVPDS